MKRSQKSLDRINSLLYLNYEVENIYLEVLDNIYNKEIRTFFKTTGFYRSEFSSVLKSEILKFGGNPIEFDKLSRNFSRILKTFKSQLESDNEFELMKGICKIKKISIDAYNNVLQERNLPLSVCKVLVGQRDNIEETLNLIKVKEQLVA